jgi:hypothetical protein
MLNSFILTMLARGKGGQFFKIWALYLVQRSERQFIQPICALACITPERKTYPGQHPKMENSYRYTTHKIAF